MNSLNAEYKLKKQFWFYGVLPLVTIYLIGIILAGYNFVNASDDCFISQSCSDLMNKRADLSMNLLKIVMCFLVIYTIWNCYRVFKLSKSGIEKAKKIRVRVYVILFPLLAIMASPFLAYGSVSLIETTYFSIFLNNFVQMFPM